MTVADQIHRVREVRPRWLVAASVAAYVVAYVLPGTGGALARTAPVGVVVTGVVLGTVTALGAMALILTYRSDRFVNFAYGAMGSLVGVLVIGLHRQHGLSFALALPLGIAAGAGVGALVQVGILRRFRTAGRLVATVATIGLAQVLGGLEVLGSNALGFIALTGAFEAPISLEIDLGARVLAGDELLIVLLAPAVLAGLAWFLTRTDIGVAVRGAAENADRARLLGIPVGRNTTAVWAIAGALAALTFILKAPFTGITPGVASTGPAVLLPALAAAVVARMESLPVALGAGIGLGVMEQIARWNTTGSPSFVDALFVLVIVVALLLQPATRARDGADRSSWSATGSVRPVPAVLARLPEVRAASAAAVVVVTVAFVLVPRGWSASNQLLASFGLVWAMVAVSLVVLTGWGGNISLGQFGLVGVGALVAGNLIAELNLDLLAVVALSGVAGGVVALLVGLPALRISGLFLAVTTIAFAVALDSYVLNLNNFPGLIPDDVPRPTLFGRFDLEDQYAMYVLCLVVLGAWILMVAGMRRARTGRALMALRDNERAAAAAGIPPARTRLGGFVLAGCIAGVAGSLHVQLLHSLSPGSYPVTDSITVFSTAVIGGLGSVAGAVTGVLLFRYLETVPALGDLRLLLTGTGLLVVLYVLPGGLGQLLLSARDRLLAVVARRRGIEMAAPGADGSERSVPVAARPERVTTTVAPTDPAAAPAVGCDGLTLAYGSLRVVDRLDLTIGEGELVALLGTNGAGKSTVLRGLAGLLPPAGGRVTIAGEDVTGLPADELARRGLALVPGGASVFAGLTVAENLRLAAWTFRRDGARVARARAEVLDLFPVLADRLEQAAGDLSGGEQQMLGLAGALMGEPRVLLIDELSLGLAPTVVGKLLGVVRSIHQRGTTVVVVEQSVNVALDLAARAVFMERGAIRFEGATVDLLDRPDLLRSVFIDGTAPPTGAPGASDGWRTDSRGAPTASAAPVGGAGPAAALTCVGMQKRYGGVTAVNGIDLRVGPGEIVGLVGHNGAGKTTLLDAISGFVELDLGQVLLGPVDVSHRPASARAAAGLGRSFQDARLFPSLSVAETIAVARERHLTSRSVLADALQLPASYESELRVDESVDELLELMGLTAMAHRLTGELSTGTRRIVDLACTLAHEPTVLLLDEPSSGVAQRETEALGGLLARVRDRTGCALVVVEHDMPLLRSLADRLVALELGTVIAEGAPDDVLAHPAVVASYLGTEPAVIERSGPPAPPRPRRPAPLRAPA